MKKLPLLLIIPLALAACVGPEKPATLPPDTTLVTVPSTIDLNRADFRDFPAYRAAWELCGGKGWQAWPEIWANGQQTFSCSRIN